MSWKIILWVGILNSIEIRRNPKSGYMFTPFRAHIQGVLKSLMKQCMPVSLTLNVNLEVNIGLVVYGGRFTSTPQRVYSWMPRYCFQFQIKKKKKKKVSLVYWAGSCTVLTSGALSVPGCPCRTQECVSGAAPESSVHYTHPHIYTQPIHSSIHTYKHIPTNFGKIPASCNCNWSKLTWKTLIVSTSICDWVHECMHPRSHIKLVRAVQM